MVVCAAALFFDRGYMSYYFFAIINDIFYLPIIWTKILACIHACIFVFMILYGEFKGYCTGSIGIQQVFTWNNIIEHGQDIMFSAFIYIACLISFYSYRGMMRERQETNKLNRELSESNRQLKEYAERVEELAVSKERNSMGVLRKAVHALKEDKHIKSLDDSINELIHNITSIEGISVDYKSFGNLEDISPNLKNIIYWTIQEGITNGLKHGGANKFSIYIDVNENNIRLLLKDNGSGCKKIVKGNGLSGIEERVNVLNGSIQYLNDMGEGFGFDISIPIQEVVS